MAKQQAGAATEELIARPRDPLHHQTAALARINLLLHGRPRRDEQ